MAEPPDATAPPPGLPPDLPLDLPLNLPLRGSRLVEASAGTGKTWTIAALYVRLVLGHGEGLGRALLPGEILVMTFTKAATRELSDRIRRRLVQAAAFFRQSEGDDGARGAGTRDPFLHALRESFAAGKPRHEAAWRLAAAAEAMDDASVHTIDAWCQRMLREHAFDSGCLFDEELQPNETQMLRQAAQDYWRQQVYPLRGDALGAVLAQWRNVAALIEDVRSLVEQPLPPGAGEGDLVDVLAAQARAIAARCAELKAGWAERVRHMRTWLDRELARKPKVVNLQARHVEDWLDALQAWVDDPGAEVPALSETAWERLTRADLAERAKGPLPADMPEGFDAMGPLRAALQALPRLPPLLRAHAVARVRQRMQHLKEQAGRYGYADMLQRLDDALDETRRGEHARQLRDRIVAQYPAALIDEFQDTSPRQLSIFDRVYRIADDDPARVLLLIGDPKQSIYAFRGADIHSYLRARAATAGRHHALAVNRRSTRALVRSVNALFAGAEARAGRGAFFFRDVAHPGSEGLPFEAVEAAGRGEALRRGRRERAGGTPDATAGGEVPALTFCIDTELRGLAEHRAQFAALCAERIVALLSDASATFTGGDDGPRRVEPGDLAVLVRTGTEAEAVQRALRRRGVPSVYLSDKDSVYQRLEAAELLRLLEAVAQPRHVRLARAAFATRLLGRTLPELLHLAADDLAFDTLCEHLRTLHGVWQTQGVLAMLRRALHLFDIPARLLAGSGDHGEARADDDGEGERRLTNVLHLAELLQAASRTVEGEPALVRWLAGQIEAARGDFTPAEELVLRLESDARLVQVVTVHKAKGLEYPVVFVPFASGYRDAAQLDDWVVERDAASGAPRLDLAPGKAALQAHDDERLQEDLRLLYVALTRARHALWVGAAALRIGSSKECQWHRSALGHLVSGEAPCDPSQIALDLHVLAEATPSIELEVLERGAHAGGAHVPATRWQPPAAEAALPPLRTYDGDFDRRWALASYSALVRDAAHGAAQVHGAVVPVEPTGPMEPLPTRVQRDADDDEEALAPAATDLPAERSDHGEGGGAAGRSGPWHRFPRGAFAGNFLHDQLEWLAGEGFALAGSPALREALVRRCERQGWGHRAADVVQWLQRVVSQPLPPLGVALDGLPGRVLPEMEFWLPADGLDVERLDALCREHLFAGEPRPALTPRVLRGLLMGFADLVFEHASPVHGPDGPDGPDGTSAVRHWVLDYKSNALGAGDADYTDDAMRTAMLRHRYDVQAALYLLALHRLLRRRLGERHEPGRDLGGAIYLFLRGVGHAGGGCVHVVAPPPLLHALEAMLPAARRVEVAE
ncbi:MAG: exodeoxyribonuclease V subunit beta [Rubrivivax sp.]|nr:exodeoxyribonuclease V subunit beta [Rubrivivax sp.]